VDSRRKKDPASAKQGGMAQVTKDCVHLKSRWGAHKDVIKSIQVVREPNCIISCGMDRRVHVWSMDGEKFGTLLQGGGENKSWNFDLEYERVMLKREIDENAKVEQCIQEASEIDIHVDTSIPPPTPPPRGVDREDPESPKRPGTSQVPSRSPAGELGRSRTSLGGSGAMQGGLNDLFSPKTGSGKKGKRSTSRISLARQQQTAAIDPMRSSSVRPSNKLTKKQNDAADALQKAVKDAMLGLWNEDE